MTDQSTRQDRMKRGRKPASSPKPQASSAKTAKKSAPAFESTTIPDSPSLTPTSSLAQSTEKTTPQKIQNDPLADLRENPERIEAISQSISALLFGDPRVNHALFGTARKDLSDKIGALLLMAITGEEANLHALFLPLIERGFKAQQFTHLLSYIETAIGENELPQELAQTLTIATQRLRPACFGN